MNSNNNTWKVVLIIIGIVIAAIGVGYLFVQSDVNGAIDREQRVQSSLSDIDVQEQRRASLIPNLVECVKGYSEHEYNTLMDTIAERGSDSPDTTKFINAVAEAYPDLKADATYKTLMNELSTTENLIAQYRKTYNTQVQQYNQYVRSFPRNCTLGMGGYTPYDYGYLDYGTENDDAPVVSFD